MLAANEAVARYLCQHKAVAIYRVHEDPDPERLFSFIQMARQMGVQSRIPSRPSPKELALLIQELERHPRGRILSDSLLRAMAKARYDRNNLGHFALSSTYYCHFTSPIRRYADDCIHRALKAALKHEPNPLPGATAEKLSAWISETERRAIAAERAVTDLKVARYYQKHLGEIKHGMIVGLTSNMAFVRLEDGAEGAMLFRDLPAYYRLNESGIQAYPDSHGPILSLGDQVRVQIARVDLERRSIDLHLLEQESALPALHMRNSRGTRGFRSRRGKKPGRGSQAGKRTVRGSHRGRGSQSSHEGKTAQGSQTGKLRSNRRTKVGQRIGKGAQATRKTRISKKGQRKQR